MEDYMKFARKYLLVFALIFGVSAYFAICHHVWALLAVTVPSGIGTWICLRVVLGKQAVYFEKEPKKVETKPKKEIKGKPMTAYDYVLMFFITVFLLSFIALLLPLEFETRIYIGLVWSFSFMVLIVMGIHIAIKEAHGPLWWPWWPWY